MYGKGELVHENGKAYTALRPNKGKLPSTSKDYWMEHSDNVSFTHAMKGADKANVPDWNKTELNKTGDLRKDGGTIYRARIGNQKKPSENPQFWMAVDYEDKPIILPRGEDDKPIVLPKYEDPKPKLSPQMLVVEQHGFDGKDGCNGIDGKDGIDGRDGKDGKDGEKGEQGIEGPQGPPGEVIYAESHKGGGGSSNKHRIYSVGLGTSLVKESLPSTSSIKSLKAGTNFTITDDGLGTLTLNSTGSSGGGTWGSITGTLSDQTDLQTALTAKQNTISLTTTGTSGASTFNSGTGVLNIPTYANTTYSAGTGLTLTSTTFSVNTSQNIATLSNLTSNGFVKTSGSTGALSIDTSTYLTNITGLVTAGTNISISGSGTSGSPYSISSTGVSVTPFSEVPSGTINSSNKIFTLANTPAAAAGVQVTLDGVVQVNGTDFTVSGTTITFVSAPVTSSTIYAFYNTSTSTGTYVNLGSGSAGQYYSTEFDNGNATGTATINWANSNVQYVTLTGNTTFTFTNPGAGSRLILEVAGAFTPTFPSTLRWSGGTTPTATATSGHKDVYTFLYSGKDGLYSGSALLNIATT